MSAPKYCDDPDHCTYSDCPTAFCDRDGSTHSLQRPCSAISEQQLNKMDVCRHLLPDPGPEVAGQLIAEIRRLRGTLAWIAGQQNLFFAECSQAEEIVARCKEALSPNAPGERPAGSAHPTTLKTL